MLSANWITLERYCKCLSGRKHITCALSNIFRCAWFPLPDLPSQLSGSLEGDTCSARHNTLHVLVSNICAACREDSEMGRNDCTCTSILQMILWHVSQMESFLLWYQFVKISLNIFGSNFPLEILLRLREMHKNIFNYFLFSGLKMALFQSYYYRLSTHFTSNQLSQGDYLELTPTSLKGAPSLVSISRACEIDLSLAGHFVRRTSSPSPDSILSGKIKPLCRTFFKICWTCPANFAHSAISKTK